MEKLGPVAWEKWMRKNRVKKWKINTYTANEFEFMKTVILPQRLK